MLIPRNSTKCVAFVSVLNENGAYEAKGTAFLVSMPIEQYPNLRFRYWVTCQHVVNQAQGQSLDGRIYLRINDNDGGTCLLRAEPGTWCMHPTNPSIDVAIHVNDLSRAEGLSTDLHSISTCDFLSNDQINVGEKAFFTPFDNDYAYSSKLNPPIKYGRIVQLSKEITSLIGKSHYHTLDENSTGGYSGTPCSTQLVHGQRLGFIGMVAGHLTDTGEAYIVPAEDILEVLNQTELSEARESALSAYIEQVHGKASGKPHS